MINKLKKVLYGLLLTILILFIIGYIFNLVQQQLYLSQVERVNVIRLQGSIEESIPGLGMTENINPRIVSQKLEQAERNDTIKAVVLRINSPGGSVAASQEIADLIRDFEKPLIISMGDIATSGGYYISAPADAVIAQPGTMTGSIGVIMATINFDGLMEKIGVEVDIIKSGEHKDLMQRTPSPEERELLQEISNRAYNQFINEIAESRNLDLDKVRELATGEIFTGEQARELQLVDQLGGIEEAVDLASELADLEDPVKYEQPSPGVLDQLRGTTYQLKQLIKRNWFSEELIIWEKLNSDIPYRLRYEVR